MIISSRIILRDQRLSDVRNNYAWQTDPGLSRLDAVSPLVTSFSDYLSAYTTELRYPSSARHSFAIETRDGKHIGNCTYYGINETKEEAELGIVIGDRNYWGKGYGTEAVTALLNYIFSETNIKRICLKTLDWNWRAQKCFKKCGFTPYGHLPRNKFNFVLMKIDREQWQKHRQNWGEFHSASGGQNDDSHP
jgi:RimJ/RimL family protein N-acetyltransferase